MLTGLAGIVLALAYWAVFTYLLPRPLAGAVIAFVLWVAFTFFFPLGPLGTAVHLLLGLAGVLLVQYLARRDAGAAPAPGA